MEMIFTADEFQSRLFRVLWASAKQVEPLIEWYKKYLLWLTVKQMAAEYKTDLSTGNRSKCRETTQMILQDEREVFEAHNE